MEQFDKIDLSTLPTPANIHEANGQATGVLFKSSFLDWNLRPARIRLVDEDNTIQVQRSMYIQGDSEDMWIDYSIQDKPSS